MPPKTVERCTDIMTTKQCRFYRWICMCSSAYRGQLRADVDSEFRPPPEHREVGDQFETLTQWVSG